MDHFEELSVVNELIESGQEAEARDSLIFLLDKIKKEQGEYFPLLNHLLRRVGLFPYLMEESSHWEDRLVVQAFKVDVGGDASKPLHREQSLLLSKLLSGESVAVSAPTSFGKSFVIDAFISVSKPSSVLIIVPTIALMDEARRRLQRKFGAKYQVITTTDVDIQPEKAIYVFPQERAITYANRIKKLDLLVIDEFYKASANFDKVRSPALVRAILRFSKVAKQRYFLAPNISELRANPLTKGMEFLKLDFNTVVLRVHDLSSVASGSLEKKVDVLKELIVDSDRRSLIYAGSHPQVSAIAKILEASLKGVGSLLLTDFADWLGKHYARDWKLSRLVAKGVGLHNGQLHRALSQIQVRLFEEAVGLKIIISTSSIIEGVNTSAERVIVWSNKSGNTKLTNFDYRNILGRGGRMFRHFVGEVYVLEQPPKAQDEQLELTLPDSLLGMEELDHLRDDLSDLQREKAEKYVADIDAVFDFSAVRQMQAEGQLQASDGDRIAKMFRDVRADPQGWRCLAFLNSAEVRKWDSALYRVINLDRAGWDAKFSDVVAFVKVASSGWNRTIPQQLNLLSRVGLGIEDYFKLERSMSFKLSSLLGDINAIHARLNPDRGFDISRFIFRMSHAFLPPLVYQLEEIGLPRMVSRRIHDVGIVDLTVEGVTLAEVVDLLRGRAREVEVSALRGVFEKYLFEYFIEGISSYTSRDERVPDAES